MCKNRLAGIAFQWGFAAYLEQREAAMPELPLALPFPDWLVKELSLAYAAGRKSVLGDLRPEDEK